MTGIKRISEEMREEIIEGTMLEHNRSQSLAWHPFFPEATGVQQDTFPATGTTSSTCRRARLIN